MIWFLATPAALLLVDSLGVRILKLLATDQSAIQRYIIVGANQVGVELARRIEHSYGNFFGFLDFCSADRLIDVLEKRVTSGCTAQELAYFVRKNSISKVHLALPISTSSRIVEGQRIARHDGLCLFRAQHLRVRPRQARCVAIDGMPAFSICDSPLEGMNGVWKPLFDVVLASLMLILISPALLAVGLAIKYTTPGPILFKQRRYGLNGSWHRLPNKIFA